MDVDISEMIKKLAEDDQVRALISSLQAPEKADPVQNDTADDAPASETDASPSISPELLQKLPQVMSALSSLGTDAKPDAKSDKGRTADRKKLLLALKPFLSRRRREAIDSIIGIAGLSDILRLI